MPEPAETKSFDELRHTTLLKIQELSGQLKDAPNEKFDEMLIRFKMSENDLDLPFWNAINGSMADSLYHVRQVVSYRRCVFNASTLNLSLSRLSSRQRPTRGRPLS